MSESKANDLNVWEESQSAEKREFSFYLKNSIVVKNPFLRYKSIIKQKPQGEADWTSEERVGDEHHIYYSFEFVEELPSKEIINQLQMNSNLRELKLKNEHMADFAMEYVLDYIGSSETITKLDLSHNSMAEKSILVLSQSILKNSSLVYLNLEMNAINSNGIELIFNSIKQNTTLRNINVAQNFPLTDGAKAIIECLKSNQSLVTLNLRESHISDIDTISLIESLSFNSTLQRINLSGNNLQDKDGILMKRLDTNTLKKLCMGNNDLGIASALSISKFLLRNHSLEILKIDFNAIGPDGVYHISNALLSNSTLKTLSMNNVTMGSDGAGYIADALEKNSTLKKLSISSNFIQDVGAILFARVFKVGVSLLSLDISLNNIRDRGILSMIKCLKLNTKLNSLLLDGNGFGKEGTGGKILKFIKKKPHFVKFSLFAAQVQENIEIEIQDRLKMYNNWRSHYLFAKKSLLLKQISIFQHGRDDNDGDQGDLEEKIDIKQHLWIYWITRKYFPKDIAQLLTEKNTIWFLDDDINVFGKKNGKYLLWHEESGTNKYKCNCKRESMRKCKHESERIRLLSKKEKTLS